MWYRNLIELAVPLAPSVRLSMAPILFHEMSQLGFSVVCIESGRPIRHSSHLHLENLGSKEPAPASAAGPCAKCSAQAIDSETSTTGGHMNSSPTNIRRGAARRATLATLAWAGILVAPALGHAQAAGAGDGGVSAFYAWKDAVPATPGKLLRSEPQEEKLALVGASRSVRILYSSTDGLDGHSPIAVSGALYLPKGAPPEGGWPLMAWAHGTVGHRRCLRALLGGTQ